MATKKRLAPGVIRRKTGEIEVEARVWGRHGARKRVLPADTPLHEALRFREELCSELKGAPIIPERSLTFHKYIELYRDNAGPHARNSIVDHIDREIGHLSIPEIENAWDSFIIRQEHRNRSVYRRINGKLKLVDTGKPLSPATVKAYKRYFKAICGYAMSRSVPKAVRLSEDPSAGTKIGKAEKRRRPLSPREREAIHKAAQQLYPWIVPVIQFASTMPIRPEDQCALTADMIDEVHSQIPYLPNKTRKTGTYAYPIILPHLREYILGRIGDAECSTIFYSVDETGRRVPLTYWRINSAWKMIRKKAGTPGIRFYDLRHDAVSYCLNAGFTTRDVMAFAGWNSAEMVDGYDTRDRIRLADRAREIINSGALDRYMVYAMVNARGEKGVKYGI